SDEDKIIENVRKYKKEIKNLSNALKSKYLTNTMKKKIRKSIKDLKLKIENREKLLQKEVSIKDIEQLDYININRKINELYNEIKKYDSEIKSIIKNKTFNQNKAKVYDYNEKIFKLQQKIEKLKQKKYRLDITDKDLTFIYTVKETDEIKFNITHKYLLTQEKNKISGEYVFEIKDNIIIGDKHIFYDKVKEHLYEKIENLLKNLPNNVAIKFNLGMYIEMININGTDIINFKFYAYPSGNKQIIYKNTDKKIIRELLDKAFSNIAIEIDAFLHLKSGWIISKIINMDFKYSQYKIIQGSGKFILPTRLKNKKAVINVDNDDDKCFLYAVASCLLNINKNPQDHKKYKKIIQNFIINNISFPFKVSDVKKFEKYNIDLLKKYGKEGINIFWYNEFDEVVPLYINRKCIDDDKIINILYLEDKNNRSHYVWIKNFSKLINSKNSDQKYICFNCLNVCYSKEALKNHKEMCYNQETCKIILPNEKNSWLYFKNYHKKLKIPISMFSDIECFTEKYEDMIKKGVKSIKYQKHKVSGISLYTINEINNENIFQIFNKCESYILQLIINSNYYLNLLKTNKKMKKLTKKQLKEFNECNICHICEQKIINKAEKVKDHDHYSGKYRGVAHYDCNLNFNLKTKLIPIYFHNLKGYDSHFLIKSM